MKIDFITLKSAIRAFLNEEVQFPTGFTWRNLLSVWAILPITVCVTLMIYTETPIMGKPYLLFVPSAVVSMFVIFTQNSKWLNKDFNLNKEHHDSKLMY